MATGSIRSMPLSSNMQHEAETVVFLGWNDSIWHMIYELDASVGYGSKVISYSQIPAGERRSQLEMQQKYYGYKLVNFVHPPSRSTRRDEPDGGVFLEDGIIGSRFQLEAFMEKHAMPIDRVSRVFVLTDSANKNDDPDSGVVSTVLHVRQILKALHDREAPCPRLSSASNARSGPAATRAAQSSFVAAAANFSISRKRQLQEIPIIVEVRERETEEQCKNIEVMDLVDSVTISAQVLSMLAYEPRLSGMLQELISEKGSMTFAIRDLQDYLEEGEEAPSMVSFFDATRLGLAQDELVIGWSRPRLSDSSSSKVVSFHMVDELAAGGATPLTDSAAGGASPYAADGGGASPYAAVQSADQLAWDMNPEDKSVPRLWRTGPAGDRLAVLCERSMG